MIAVKRPASMSMLTSSSASTRASPSPYALVTPSARAAVPVVGRLSITVMVRTRGCAAPTGGPTRSSTGRPAACPQRERRTSVPTVRRGGGRADHRPGWGPPPSRPVRTGHPRAGGGGGAGAGAAAGGGGGRGGAAGRPRPEAVAGWLGAAGCVLAVYVVVVLG